MHIVTFAALADFPNLLEAHVYAFPKFMTGEQEAQEASPRLLEIVNAVLSFEADVFHVNLAAVLDRDKPTVDMKAHPTEHNLKAKPAKLSDLLVTFQGARQRTLSILEGLQEGQWARTAQCDDAEITVVSLLHLLSANDWDQLASLQRLLGACSAP